MKMLLIAYGEAIDEEVLEALAAAGAENYTKWTRVQGKGTTSGPHLASHVWPKQNNVLAVAVDDERVAGILEGIRKLRARLGDKGVKAFVLPVDAMT